MNPIAPGNYSNAPSKPYEVLCKEVKDFKKLEREIQLTSLKFSDFNGLLSGSKQSISRTVERKWHKCWLKMLP
jgi:hypothetical protein